MQALPPLEQQIEKLLSQQKALATFGTFAFAERDLNKVLSEAARVCADCLDIPFSKICKYQKTENDLRVVAGYGWKSGVVGYAISVANESSLQGRAFSTGEPQVCANVEEANTYSLPPFYSEHAILSTVDVIVAAKIGVPFGVLEVDSPVRDAFNTHDIDFLTGFANILAEAVATSERSDALLAAIARMEELVDEKEVLSQELKHRVRNSLHLVYGLLTSEVHAKHDKTSTMAFRAVALRVLGLAGVFDHLLGVGMSATIGFGDYLDALCHTLPDLYKEEAVTLTCSAAPITLDLEMATSLGIIVTELVSNAYTHAFPERLGTIHVDLSTTPGGASLSVSDSGTGFVESETKRRGVGLVRRLVEQVGGTFSLRSDHGTTWTIDFVPSSAAPLAAA
jgi:two-component sensor histidine kinase